MLGLGNCFQFWKPTDLFNVEVVLALYDLRLSSCNGTVCDFD